MKKSVAFCLIAGCITIVSCSKRSSGPDEGHGASSLFPLTAGDMWCYQDSVFADTGLEEIDYDTMTVNSQRVQDNFGTTYVGITNPGGWFQGSYIQVDPSNTTVYEVDSPAYSPYTFFQAVPQDGPIGTGADYSNPGCPIQSIQYGYSTPVSVAGYSCLKNAEVVTDCNNVIREEIFSYLSPGVGVVRIEDFVADSTNGNKLYQEYSQTLTNKVLH
ncbi:MAG: hypothetical protein JST42_26995 [Bacteroidetes bacterium]|nr:hypothetical protein [Bacteroidota bacterium]